MSAEQPLLIASGDAGAAVAIASPPRRQVRLKRVNREQMVWRATGSILARCSWQAEKL